MNTEDSSETLQPDVLTASDVRLVLVAVAATVDPQAASKILHMLLELDISDTRSLAADVFLKRALAGKTPKEFLKTPEFISPLGEEASGFGAPPNEELLSILLARLRQATNGRGGRRVLADAIGVSASSVSQWLTGAHSPGGEQTLRMLSWLQSEEGKRRASGSEGTSHLVPPRNLSR